MADKKVLVDIGVKGVTVHYSDDLEIFEYEQSYVDEVLAQDPINAGHIHEIMDRLHNASNIIEGMFDGHPAFITHKSIQDEVSKAVTHLQNAYQYAGALTIKYPSEFDFIRELLDKEVEQNGLSGYDDITCPKLKFLLSKINL